jgi:hypothetical protein
MREDPPKVNCRKTATSVADTFCDPGVDMQHTTTTGGILILPKSPLFQSLGYGFAPFLASRHLRCPNYWLYVWCAPLLMAGIKTGRTLSKVKKVRNRGMDAA